LRSALPRLTRVGALINPDNGSHGDQLQGIMQAAQKVGAQVVSTGAATIADIESAFGSLARERAGACILFGDTFFTQELEQIAQAALKHRMPSIYLPRDYARAGGLMSYGPDFVDNFRRAASFVDKILKGAKPGELSFQQPTKYVFAINLKTAKALGVSVPQALLLRADEVIE
jgi:putative ABC transport system substrate-binding protein